MKAVRPRWILKDAWCPCLCGGDGRFGYSVCPRCDGVLLICTEVGTGFRLGEFDESIDAKSLCPSCGAAPLDAFVNATSEPLDAAGIGASQREAWFSPER